MMTMSPLLQPFPVGCHVPRPGGTSGSRADAGDEATSSLLTFVDMASSNIKLALDKPVRSKRKVNHRKYLQKQLKRCNTGSNHGPRSKTLNGSKDSRSNDDEDDDSGSIESPPPPSGTSPSRTSPPVNASSRPTSVVVSHGQAAVNGCKAGRKEAAQAGLQNKSLAALFDPRTLHERCCTDPQPRVGTGKVPLRQRNLPASFFTEPAAHNASLPPLSTCSHGRLTSPTPVGFTFDEAYRQHPSSQHGGGPAHHMSSEPCSAELDTVDQMLRGAPTSVEDGARGGLEEILAHGGSAWTPSSTSGGVGAVDDTVMSRRSANTTPCNSTSGGGVSTSSGGVSTSSGGVMPQQATPQPPSVDLLATALNSADVNCDYSPAASPTTSPSYAPGSTAWASATVHPAGAARLTEASPIGDNADISRPQSNQRPLSSCSSTNASSTLAPFSPLQHHNQYDISLANPYSCVAAPATPSHYSPIPGYVPPAQSISSITEYPYGVHNITTQHQQPSTIQQHHSLCHETNSKSVFHTTMEDSRYGSQIPIPGGTPSGYCGSYGSNTHTHTYHTGNYNQHYMSEHHQGVMAGFSDPYSRDPSTYWQGTAVYGQLTSCYPYL